MMQKLKDEQEILMHIADMIMEVFATESVVLRTQRMVALKGEAEAQPYVDMMKVYVSDAIERVNLSGKHALQSFAEGDELRMMMMGLKRFTKYDFVNTTRLRRNIAARLIEANEYCF